MAVSAEGLFKFETGKSGAQLLGYDSTLLAGLSDELLSSFCGVGNPFSIGTVQQGDIVLDLGCGAGLDIIVAAQLVGEQGAVYGLDLSEEMVQRATENCRNLGLVNVSVNYLATGDIPYSDDMFDVVISNGVINLIPDKEMLFKDLFRLLKGGGSLQFADIISQRQITASKSSRLASWFQ